MKTEGGIILTEGFHLFPDSQGPQCDISAPMNAYSVYNKSNQYSYILPSPVTGYTTVDFYSSFNVSTAPVFCGAHQFTGELNFAMPYALSGGNYLMRWNFYNASTNALMSTVSLTSGFNPSGIYTVAYNNGLTSYPSGTVTETSTSSAFKMSFYYGVNMGARGYFH
jgi:hypothetical protein